MQLTDKKIDVLVMGMGKTGLSCIQYFSKQGKKIAVYDDNKNRQGEEMINQAYPDVEIHTGGAVEEVVTSSGQLVVSPGIPLSHKGIQLAISEGIEVTSDVKIFLDRIASPVLAITGSNGKSTVASMLTQMIARSGKTARLGGNIGIPVLGLLEQPAPDFYVLELSSYQLELLDRLNATASVLLNISEDHVTRYDNLQDYADVKARIYAGEGVMIINRDDNYVASLESGDRLSYSFTTGAPKPGQFGLVNDSEGCFLSHGNEKLVKVSNLKVKGNHNYANALAALAMGHAVQIPFEPMISALCEFSGLPHRCQLVESVNQVDWYNDSKATNPAATISAIKSLCNSNEIILIAGGISKNADFKELADICSNNVKAVILYGKDARIIHKALKNTSDVIYSTSLESAVITAHELSRPGDAVLFSPACSSFDMFDNFEHRGEVFTSAVEDLCRGLNT